ncbi:GFA family protein [Phenylobacterium sp.]|uniref:GFA family protein n=1 Tax=Phenylobacterium sp. TaxID=1871053 RepID=UPI002F94122A
MTHEGGCKCGAVAFEADGEIEKVIDCNCSICRPKGYLHWFVPEAAFRLKTDDAAMGAFTFKSHKLIHRFCKTCGVAPFVQGPGTVAVNARALHGVDIQALNVQPFDGASL